MNATHGLSRRRFLQQSAALVAGGLAVPCIVPSRALAGANERITVGYIGAGRRALQLTGLPKESQILAVADVDMNRARTFATKYKCEAYQDYRKLLERKDIQAVIISTPDHWHALATIHACQAGKDIYVEKPLALTIREGRAMVEAARKYKRVVQTGSQRRSMKYHRLGCELVRNGVAGRIHTVLIMNYPSPWKCALPAQPVPDGLDWDTWCGQTQPVPFNQDIFIQRSNPGWMSFQTWSGGEPTNTGAHGLDQVQWALDMDHTGPVEIWAEGGKLEPPAYTQPESGARGNTLCGRGHRVRMRYENGIELKLEEGESAAGATFVGDRGRITIGNNKVTSDPAELAAQPPQDMKIRVEVSDNHFQNWFDCIKSRGKPIADVEIGHRSAILCHFCNIARWVGRKLRWDPEKEIFPDDAEANSHLERPMRKPFQLPERI